MPNCPICDKPIGELEFAHGECLEEQHELGERLAEMLIETKDEYLKRLNDLHS